MNELSILIYMYLKFNIFNMPIFNIKMMKKWFEWMIQWLLILHLFHYWMIQCFWTNLFNEWFNDTFFFNSHLVAKQCNQQTLFEAPVAFKRGFALLNVSIWTILCWTKLSSLYFCDNMNECKTEIILCSCKDCLWSCFLPKHGKYLLSVSAAA